MKFNVALACDWCHNVFTETSGKYFFDLNLTWHIFHGPSQASQQKSSRIGSNDLNEAANKYLEGF